MRKTASLNEVVFLYKMKQMILNEKLNAAQARDFDELYPYLNEYVAKGENRESRNGDVYEVLNFKTEILNPIARCVGTHNRDINIFFLLAEAIWIWQGRKDVEFLKIFNSRMGNFSDNGDTFHAPYGFRMRNWGVSSDHLISEENKHAFDKEVGTDQIFQAVKMLKENPNNRRVVISIWNPSLDLNYPSKDIPCNDMLMLKIRDGQLHGTIQNRSNDLHWGLPTKCFPIFLYLGIDG